MSKDLRYTLARFIIDQNDRYSLRAGTEEEIEAHAARLPEREKQIADQIWEEHHSLSNEALLERVYKSFPWYASRSERVTATLSPPKVPVSVFTIGYESRSVDEFFDIVLRQGLKGLLDVRRNAYSHKYGFSGHALRDVCTRLNLVYEHAPELGIASEFRQGLDSAEARKHLFDNYEHKLSEQSQEVDLACQVVSARPTALLCFELKSEDCHRGRLARQLSLRTGFEIHHL